MDLESMIEKAAPRVCTARQINHFDRDDVIGRLFRREEVHGDFRIVEQLARPSAETSFDVCSDGESLYVSVLFWEAGEYYGTGVQTPASEGAGNHCVEVLICPYGDRLGFLQFGAGPGTDTWFLHHWPYRDERLHLGARPVWEVAYTYENMEQGEERAWMPPPWGDG